MFWFFSVTEGAVLSMVNDAGGMFVERPERVVTTPATSCFPSAVTGVPAVYGLASSVIDAVRSVYPESICSVTVTSMPKTLFAVAAVPFSSTVTVGGVFSTMNASGPALPALPAASVAVAAMVCGPSVVTACGNVTGAPSSVPATVYDDASVTCVLSVMSEPKASFACSSFEPARIFTAGAVLSMRNDTGGTEAELPARSVIVAVSV